MYTNVVAELKRQGADGKSHGDPGLLQTWWTGHVAAPGDLGLRPDARPERHSLDAASTAETGICPKGENGGNRAAATKVGKALAARALEKGIKRVAFDRGRYRYHGRIAALADAAREGGLEF